MALSTPELAALYQRRARGYDTAVRLLRLTGIDLARYRREMAAALALEEGAAVVELGCGTGLNFDLVCPRIGREGRLVAVDLTEAMLDVARQRVRRAGWQNVTLVRADMADWPIPAGVDAIYSTFALTLVAEYAAVVERAAGALRPGGRLAILDLKEPERWPQPLVRFAAWLNRPFGVTLDLAERHPWEALARHLPVARFDEYFSGAVYLCVGRKHGSRSAPKRL